VYDNGRVRTIVKTPELQFTERIVGIGRFSLYRIRYYKYFQLV
jgi:hypothetical protein